MSDTTHNSAGHSCSQSQHWERWATSLGGWQHSPVVWKTRCQSCQTHSAWAVQEGVGKGERRNDGEASRSKDLDCTLWRLQLDNHMGGLLQLMTQCDVNEKHLDWKSREGDEIEGVSLRSNTFFFSAASTQLHLLSIALLALRRSSWSCTRRSQAL